MRPISQANLVLLAAAYLHVPSRRLRALARGQDESLREWVAGESARRLAHARHQAREAAARLERLHAHLVTIADAAYPPGLLDLADPPPFLCVRGTLPLGGIAIVGNRTPTDEAREFARELAERCGEAVVSGLAAGIDEAAHRGAITAGNATIAYVGTGIGVTYPPEHRVLEEAIVAHGGAIASERLIDEPVSKAALAHRDRLQAAHARAVVLVCSEIDGGAMQTMRFAKELRRPCYALRPPHGAEGRREYGGNERVLADGAVALPLDIKKAVHTLHAH
ncbi:MAG: DNA-processing protein DprA [Vulcanimicrobiaceae bacterium]